MAAQYTALSYFRDVWSKRANIKNERKEMKREKPQKGENNSRKNTVQA